MRHYFFSLALFIFAILSVGCTTQNATIISNTDRNFELNRNAKIHISTPASPTVDQKNKIYDLRRVLEAFGYQVTRETAGSDYTLDMSIIHITSNVQTTCFGYSLSSGSGQIGAANLSAQSTTVTASPCSTVVGSTNARFQMYETKNIAGGEVWAGTIAMHSSVFDKYFKDALEKLIAVLGSDYNRTVFIP